MLFITLGGTFCFTKVIRIRDSKSEGFERGFQTSPSLGEPFAALKFPLTS
jgi:hypothetical protein